MKKKQMKKQMRTDAQMRGVQIDGGVQMRGVQIDGGVQTDGWLISDALRGSNRGSNSSTVHGQQKQQ
jgi:hypothetical protein